MSEQRRFWPRWWLELLAAALLLAPLVVLLAAGTLWLWQRGWLLWWLLAAASVAAIAWSSVRWRHRPLRGPSVPEQDSITHPDPTWAPHEQVAWDSVRRLSSEADGAILEHRELLLAAAQQTLEAVAQHYHPRRVEPALHFTLPELLLLTERVSARLRLLLLEQVPLSHRLKAGHLVRVWGYRPLIEAGFEQGRKVYAVMRFARMINPLNALVAELRDHLMDDLFQNLQSNVRRRIVRIWIEEVGRAAIDLYSGRLRVDALELAKAAGAEGLEGAAVAAAPPGALRLLIAGQTKAGKSTLVNSLLGELSAGVDVLPLTAGFEGYELRQESLPPAYLIDSPGIDDAAGVTELVKRAFASDLIIWVVAAHRADRAFDRKALDELRARFAADPQRKMPPVVVVASHADRLSPVREWAPPYNVDTPSGIKEQSIREALDVIAADLLVAIEAIVPMRLDSTPPYNLDLLWLRLESVVGDAQRARWVRILRTAIGRRDWRRSWKQLVRAGRMVGGLVRR
jgi:uncharacterized protein